MTSRVVLLFLVLLAFPGAPLSVGVGRVAAQTPARPRTSGPPPLWDALDRYSRSEFDEAVARAMRVGFDPAQADAWIAAGKGPAQASRRTTAAICALEVAASRPFLIPRLLPWAREAMSAGSPGPTEALWLRASIALAEGFGRWTFLLEDAPPAPLLPPTKGKPAPPPPPPPIAHLKFARQRLGDNPYVAMAEVVGAEYLTSPAIVGGSTKVPRSVPGVDRLGGDQSDRTALESAGAIPLLDAAAATATRLTTVEPFGDEAHVRLGYIRLRLGHTDAALESFDRVSLRTSNRDLRYLARLYTAVTLDRLNRVDEAASMYRASLELIPGARSATTLLTTLLVRVGRLDESEAIATAFMEAPRAAEDPWRSYLLGDYPNARPLMLQLRQAVR